MSVISALLWGKKLNIAAKLMRLRLRNSPNCLPLQRPHAKQSQWIITRSLLSLLSAAKGGNRGPIMLQRIGGGDAFAVGLLHGLMTNMNKQENIEFAAPASALKHSIRGDFNLVSISDVEYAMGNESLDVRR